eukprot:COSAG02_NODE_86_length_39084_cov_17.815724_23_plen_179_part_00
MRAGGANLMHAYTVEPGGSPARDRSRARAEHPTWAYRVWYRELGPIGMFRRKSLQGTGATTSAPTCARGKFRRDIPIGSKNYIELDDLLTMKLYLSRSDSGPKTLVLAVMKTHTNIHTITFKYTRSLAAGTRRYKQLRVPYMRDAVCRECANAQRRAGDARAHRGSSTRGAASSSPPA